MEKIFQPNNSNKPFYDPERTYDENMVDGPFGDFRTVPPPFPKLRHTYEIFGRRLNIPFGIPAGPLLNARFVEASWRWGFSLATYKTIRGNAYPTHPFPNIIRVNLKTKHIRPGEKVFGDLNTKNINIDRDGITNSFNIPSKDPGIWRADVKKALSKMKKGEVFILSFVGTKVESMTRKEYIDNFILSCKLARQTGAPILEVNFSCPNVARAGLICNDPGMSAEILESLKSVRGNVPLLVKIGYFSKRDQKILEKFLEVAHMYADGVVAINTIQAQVVDVRGKQVLPGSRVRLLSGICGAAIRWAGLEMADRIVCYKKKKGWKNFVVIGVGGVTSPRDYFAYMRSGVDAVQSATGAMWRPTLAIDIRKELVR